MKFERVTAKFLEHMLEIVAEIKHDICMERYEEAEKKIDLLDQLLTTINENGVKK
jgi:hypothetical protein